MVNEKLITQIQELINSNNQKAITGDSLANLLIDIVTELSENSGGSSYPIYELKVPDELIFTDEDKTNNLMIRERIYNGEHPMIVWNGLQSQLLTILDDNGNVTDHDIRFFFLDAIGEPEYMGAYNLVGWTVSFYIEEDGTVTVME